MNTYFVASNLNHDGKEYKRGDTIELADASALIAAGVLQTEPVEAPAPASEAPVEPERPQAADVAEAGGKVTVSGEPSLDGVQTEATDDDAKEVGPMADMSSAAPQEPVAPASEAPASRLSSFFLKKPEATPQPLQDPSIGL